MNLGGKPNCFSQHIIQSRTPKNTQKARLIITSYITWITYSFVAIQRKKQTNQVNQM